MSGPYDKDDAAKDTDVDGDEAKEAWHSARDDRRDEYGDDWDINEFADDDDD